MNHGYRRKALLILGAASLLSGCETIGSLFPDKQKQYQYSSEIPPLEVPPDLSSSTIEGAASRRSAAAARDDFEPPASRETAAGSSLGEAPKGEAEPPAAAAARRSGGAEPTPTLAQTSGNEPIIEIEAPFEVAWIEVAKALGRLELEVSDQNRADGLYFVYYGGRDKPYEDRGMFGDIADMFSGGGKEAAKEYRVKLQPGKGKVTLVQVLDAENQPQMSGPGLDLLKRLHETLQTMAAPEPGEKAAGS